MESVHLVMAAAVDLALTFQVVWCFPGVAPGESWNLVVGTKENCRDF